MVTYFYSKSELEIGKLRHLYRCRIEEERIAKYSHLSLPVGAIEAEQDFYYNLDSVFDSNNSCIAIWLDNDRYVSSLRFEKFEDGFLITGFETDPDYIGKGYGKRLLQNVCKDMKHKKIYSHIKRDNHVSVYLHKLCGFELMQHSAVFIDGTISFDHDTWILDIKNDRF